MKKLPSQTNTLALVQGLNELRRTVLNMKCEVQRLTNKIEKAETAIANLQKATK